MTDNTLSHWQDDDGWPTDAYFIEVENALIELDIPVLDYWRDEPWDYVIRITPPRVPFDRLLISWIADEHCNPLEGGFTGHGWCWVPYTHAGQSAADEVKQLDVDFLAEPEQVAAAVAQMLKSGEGR